MIYQVSTWPQSIIFHHLGYVRLPEKSPEGMFENFSGPLWPWTKPPLNRLTSMVWPVESMDLAGMWVKTVGDAEKLCLQSSQNTHHPAPLIKSLEPASSSNKSSNKSSKIVVVSSAIWWIFQLATLVWPASTSANSSGMRSNASRPEIHFWTNHRGRPTRITHANQPTFGGWCSTTPGR